jgi:hypothetical protein
VKLFSDNIPRVYCLSHLEVIFRVETICIKINVVSELRPLRERMIIFLRHKQLQIGGATHFLLHIFVFVLGMSQW